MFDPVSADDVREWEVDFGVRLPPLLTRALMDQNEGQVRETGVDIDPLDEFSALDEEQWAHVFWEAPLTELDRSKLIYVGDAVGCGVVLDYNIGPEPRVLLLHHNLGGELRDEGISSFEDFLHRLQA